VVEDEITPAEMVRLRARIKELEQALRRKSAVLRILERELCPYDSVLLTRIVTSGLPYPESDPSLLGASDTMRLQASEVESTLAQVWRSLGVPHGGTAE
jgi:hypothetical protein